MGQFDSIRQSLKSSRYLVSQGAQANRTRQSNKSTDIIYRPQMQQVAAAPNGLSLWLPSAVRSAADRPDRPPHACHPSHMMKSIDLLDPPHTIASHGTASHRTEPGQPGQPRVYLPGDIVQGKLRATVSSRITARAVRVRVGGCVKKDGGWGGRSIEQHAHPLPLTDEATATPPTAQGPVARPLPPGQREGAAGLRPHRGPRPALDADAAGCVREIGRRHASASEGFNRPQVSQPPSSPPTPPPPQAATRPRQGEGRRPTPSRSSPGIPTSGTSVSPCPMAPTSPARSTFTRARASPTTSRPSSVRACVRACVRAAVGLCGHIPYTAVDSFTHLANVYTLHQTPPPPIPHPPHIHNKYIYRRAQLARRGGEPRPQRRRRAPTHHPRDGLAR